MTGHDPFEQRAASAGEALRAAFLVDQPTAVRPVGTAPPAGTAPQTSTAPPTSTAPTSSVRSRPPARLRPVRGLPAAAALAVVATLAGVLLLTSQGPEQADVLGGGDRREAAELAPPYLVGSGTLPDADQHAVQRFAVPFTFSDPPAGPGGRAWTYRTGEDFSLDLARNGVILLAPTGTYDPRRPWRGQRALVPAPTDADGWADWLAATGYVDVTARADLRIGGAAASRFTVELRALPDAYDACGGGRRCLAIEPFDDPSVGPGRVGTGPQSGIDDSVVELTVIELEGRAVLALASGARDATDDWLPTVRRLVDSLRFA